MNRLVGVLFVMTLGTACSTIIGITDFASNDAGALSDGSGAIDAGEHDGGPWEAGSDGDAGTADAREASPCGCASGFDCVGTRCLDRIESHFSASANPAGNWSYGYVPDNGGAFALYVTEQTVTTMDRWTIDAVHNVPQAFFNHGSVSYQSSGSNTVVPPQSFGMHPGVPSGLHASTVLRWTAPADSTYTVLATFAALDPATQTTGEVLNNGSMVFSGAIDGTWYQDAGPDQQGYQGDLPLTAGSTVDFVVANAGSGLGDATQVSISIEQL